MHLSMLLMAATNQGAEDVIPPDKLDKSRWVDPIRAYEFLTLKNSIDSIGRLLDFSESVDSNAGLLQKLAEAAAQAKKLHKGVEFAIVDITQKIINLEFMDMTLGMLALSGLGMWAVNTVYSNHGINDLEDALTTDNLDMSLDDVFKVLAGIQAELVTRRLRYKINTIGVIATTLKDLKRTDSNITERSGCSQGRSVKALQMKPFIT